MNDNRNNLSIYLHWPFCRSKCPYCDFFSQVRKNVGQDKIINDYIEQLRAYTKITPGRKIVSVFFGGGTPSLIKPQNIARIIEQIDKLWQLSEQCEISLEANPNTQTPQLFADLRQVGINRLSLGVQSLDDKQLKFLGRTHTADEALKAIDEVLQNFANHSVDLMYALPGQTPEQWQNQLEQICSFGLKHISLYQLTIEENTPFYHKGIRPLNENAAAAMYRQTEKILSSKGYDKYEVSNYAVNGFQSIHNRAYWLGQDYIGIGETAHGRLRKDGKLFAVTNPLQFEELTPVERAEELVIMGLRLTEGIDKHSFSLNCGLNFDTFINQNFKQEAEHRGLLCDTGMALKATADGFLLLNYLIAGLCS